MLKRTLQQPAINCDTLQHTLQHTLSSANPIKRAESNALRTEDAMVEDRCLEQQISSAEPVQEKRTKNIHISTCTK